MERGEPALTTLYLVRHAAHGLLGRVLTGRMPGVALSAEGRAQADALAARFAGIEIAEVLSSPVQRALETAAPVAAGLGLEVSVEAGLDEIDFGAWAGQTFEALADRPDWQEWNRARDRAGCPGGETMRAAQARAMDAVMRAHAAHAGGQVVMVSHQDVLKAVLAEVLGLGLDALHRFSLDPASCSVVRLDGGAARVDVLNLPVRC